MKKFWIIFGLFILIAGIIFPTKILYEKYKPQIIKYLYEVDCLESGFCKEGIRLKIGQDKWITINQNSCLDNNGRWYPKDKACSFR